MCPRGQARTPTPEPVAPLGWAGWGRARKPAPSLVCAELLQVFDQPLDVYDEQLGCTGDALRRRIPYGVTTGQAVAPLVVHTMRPWMAGLTGVLAAI